MLTKQFSPKVVHKVETKRKLPEFAVSGWLIMNGGESGSDKIENFKAKSCIQYEVSAQLLAFVYMNHYFHRLLISS